jgi:hypothetical protein
VPRRAVELVTKRMPHLGCPRASTTRSHQAFCRRYTVRETSRKVAQRKLPSVLLGRSPLLVGVLVLYTGVLFCYTLLVRSLVYVLGEELLLLWWLRCCCSWWPWWWCLAS